jgi:hypothetical protein
MGRSYLFECEKCSYKAIVSGGADEGNEFSVQTTACKDCRNLFDAVVRLRVPESGLRIPKTLHRTGFRKLAENTPPPLEVVMDRLPPRGIKKFKWVQFKIHCLVSLAHRVQAWNEPGKCPRCGTFLDKSALPFRHWE